MVRAGFVIALVLAMTPATAGAITTTGPTNFPVGTNPLSVRVGNFNADTDPDLATANYLSNNVSILLGNGSGGFSGPTNFAVGSRPTSVAVGDFNRDTLSDLAVTNFFNNTVSILIGNGAGGFSAPTNFAAGAKPNQVAVGNFTADNDPDLAVADYNSNKVSILLGNGLGGFSAPTAFTAGSQPASVTVGRFNGDTNLDLAVANHNPSNVSILLGNGAGGFGAPTNFAAGSAPYSVAAGDLDGDTDADLAVANYGGTVSVLLSNGLGGFTGPTNFAAGSLPYEVAVGDLDGDLDADLTVANVSGNRITVLLGNGLGSFSGPNTLPVFFSHYSVALGDFNRDAAPDFAVANSGGHNVSILLQGQQTIAVTDVSKAEGDTGQTSFVFQVTLAGGGTEPVSVDVHTEDGTAMTTDSDYTALPVQTLNFAPGETSKPVTVNVTGDIEFEANENFALVLSNPVNAAISDGTGVGTIVNDDAQGYPHPNDAPTFVEASLVPAVRKCNAPNVEHGPPLAYPSCNPPVQLSQYLTVGTPDANGRLSNSVGSVRYEGMPGDLGTGADEADVMLDVNVTDVRGSVTLGDYIAELWATVGVRLTDRPNVAPPVHATTADFQFAFAVPCASTADTTIGATCSVNTTADAVLPGSVPENSRAIWQVGQVQVQDGGDDGEGETTSDNTLFLKQGVFVP